MATLSSERYVLLNRLADELAGRYRRGERPSLHLIVFNVGGRTGTVWIGDLVLTRVVR